MVHSAIATSIHAPAMTATIATQSRSATATPTAAAARNVISSRSQGTSARREPPPDGAGRIRGRRLRCRRLGRGSRGCVGRDRADGSLLCLLSATPELAHEGGDSQGDEKPREQLSHGPMVALAGNAFSSVL